MQDDSESGEVKEEGACDTRDVVLWVAGSETLQKDEVSQEGSQSSEAKGEDEAQGSEMEGIDEDLRNHIKEQLLSMEPIVRAGQTALHRAASSGLGGVVARLLAACPSLINEEHGGAMALHGAACEGHATIVSHLLAVNPALAEARTNGGLIALHFAAVGGHEAIVAQLLAVNPASVDAVTDVGRAALHLAAEEGHAAIVGQLLAANPASIDAKTHDGWTALHLAVHSRHEEIVAQLLAAKPTSIEARTDDGQTVLQLAANHEGITTRLIAAYPSLLDAMVNDADSWTALRNVVELGHEEAMERVLAMHANLINEMSHDRGWTVFHYAAWYGREQLMSRLLETVIQPELEQLLLRKSTMYFRGTSMATALHLAARKGHCNIVVQLLSACPALIDVLDEAGQTCLHSAFSEPYAYEKSHKSQESTVDFLLAVKPALIHAVDAKRNTILHLILRYRHRRKEFVERLWKMNPDALHAVNCSGQTPFSLAVDERNTDAMDLMQWSLTIDEIESAHNACVVYPWALDPARTRNMFRARFVERFKPLVESQCEQLAVELLPDVVAIVFEYLGLRTVKQIQEDRPVEGDESDPLIALEWL